MQTEEARPVKRTFLKAVVRRSFWVIGGCAAISVAYVPRSHAQLGIDIGVILAGLQQVNSTMQSVMQAPMQDLQSTQSQMQQYEQNVMYPLNDIQNAQALAGQSLGVAQRTEAFFGAPISSATLPMNQQFEGMIFSKDPNQLANISGMYTQVFGALPASTQANSDMVGAIDAGDATAQECLKRAVQLDALSDQEMAVSQQMLAQLKTTAPGNAALISAQASAWLVQGSGYTQSALAEMLRASAAEAGYAGVNLKQRATGNLNSASGLGRIGAGSAQINSSSTSPIGVNP
jgi:hypothetical protein